MPLYGTGEILGGLRTITGEGKRRVSYALDLRRLVPLSKQYCAKYSRELAGHLARKELVECSRADWEAQQSPRAQTTSSEQSARKNGA